jgi:hypothetical protein
MNQKIKGVIELIAVVNQSIHLLKIVVILDLQQEIPQL